MLGAAMTERLSIERREENFDSRRGGKYYGKLDARNHPEAGAIWRTRNDELPDCEPHGFQHDYVSDPDEWDKRDYGEKLMLLLETLTPRRQKIIEMRYVMGMTLEECAKAEGVGSERIRQIEAEALRMLRHLKCIGTLGSHPFGGFIPRWMF